MITGYWSVIHSEWSVHGVGQAIKPALIEKQLCTSRTPLIDEQIDHVTSLWRFRLDQIDSLKRYYADPSHCGYCSYSSICRKHDPDKQWQHPPQSLLEFRQTGKSND